MEQLLTDWKSPRQTRLGSSRVEVFRAPTGTVIVDHARHRLARLPEGSDTLAALGARWEPFDRAYRASAGRALVVVFAQRRLFRTWLDIVALDNAGGNGGAPSVVSGTVTALETSPGHDAADPSERTPE